MTRSPSPRVLLGAGALAALCFLLSDADAPNAVADREAGASSDAVTDRWARAAPGGGTTAAADGARAVPVATAATPGAPGAAYLADQILVRVHVPGALDGLARAHGAAVVSPAGRSGYAALRVPAERRDAVQRALLRDDRVAAAAPMGRTQGAGVAEEICDQWRVRPAMESQWHLRQVKAPRAGTADLSGVVVAVLDTGVAYTDHTDAAGAHVQAASLAQVDFVSPWDFVNDDGHPGDDNAHGTHIASLIASEGAVEGVAQGVSIMPLKVLDQDNVGTELALIEAVYHAVDHGADVLNMSLAFAADYHPSAGLSDALQYAADAGVVMVAASGNEGLTNVSFPAASPHVIAVGASRLDAEEGAVASDYSNRGPKVDLMAPGGDLTRDEDEDGVPDGMIAETIHPQDPSGTGLYLLAGTSQSAALVSGAAAWLVAAGVERDEVRAQLQATARDLDFDFAQGTGAGELQMKRMRNGFCNDRLGDYEAQAYSASVLPYLVEEDGLWRPTAVISLVDSDGAPVFRYTAHVNVIGSTAGFVECRTGRDGTCIVEGPPVDPAVDGDAHAWAFSVDAVERRDLSHQPGSVVFANAAMESVLAELANRDDLVGALLAFEQEAESTAYGDLVESFTIVNMGTGLASSPLGIVVTTPALRGGVRSPVDDLSGALDGTGLASSPLGILAPTLMSFGVDGTGLASTPLGFLSGFGWSGSTDLDGTGLASTPLGFSFNLLVFSNSLQLSADADLDGAGLSSSPMGFTAPSLFDSALAGDDATPLMLGSGTAAGVSLEDTATGAWLEEGGSVDLNGYSAASLLITSGAVEVPAAAASLAPVGSGAEPY